MPDVEILCPDCDGVVTFEDDPIDGEIGDCPSCELEVEVVYFDPSDQASVDLIKKTAATRVKKGEPAYNVSNLHLETSPALIPSPPEGEDWGE